ncbi:tape measure protein [uncultured Mediterranea sp.]|uniref:tape measure protein n=1 Tax=uncultured Mediterranea sp. TaxID=1926662 RepID=UPI0027D9C5A2|nr:tape measure protein [uncultured Mediterranea sp.]
MATLYFKVSSDYDEVIRLRQECEKLEAQLKKMDVNKSPAAARALETQLASTRKQMMGLVTEAAKAGATMEHDFKTKIYNASQSVNDFTQKIIDQKRVVKDVEADVKRLGTAYKTALKRNPATASGLFSEYNSAKKVLDEEKAALFGLTQQQAEARLSVKRLKDEYAAFKEEAGESVEVNEKMSVSLTKVLGVIGGVTALKNFVTELVNVRGQFQQLEIAFTTMLKSKEKSDELMAELVEIAAKTPFDLQGVASSAKQMLAYGSSAENVGNELVMLGNVAAGVGSQLSEIAYLYGTLRTQGRAYAVDIRQFAGRGIPIYEELAKVLGVTKDEVSSLVTAGKVGFKEVEQAFKNMTSASGIYYNLMEEQSKSLTGQISNLGDAWDTMLNEIGKDTQGIASTGISAVKGLIENYETIGKVLIGLIATYGTYRAALMLTTVATSKHTIAEIALTSARVIARKAQMLLNAAMLTNPYVAVATVVAGLAATIWALHDSSTEAEKAQKRLNERQQQAQKEAEEHKRKIDALIESSRDIALTDLQRGQSLAELRKEYPKIFSQYDIESIKLADILKLKQQIAEEDAIRVGEKQKQDFANLENEITYYENLLKSLSGQQGVDGYVKKLKELRAERDILLKERSKGISEQFISSLKEIDISEFDRYISELEKRIKGKGESGKINMRLPIDVKGSLSDEALFEVKDIKTLIDTAKSTKQSRIDANKNQTTYQQDLASAKADWEKAKKGYETLIKDQKATSEQVKKAREEMEAKEKTYKELGGDVDKKKQIKDSSPFPKIEQSFAQDLQKRVDTAEQETAEAVNDMVQTILDGLDAEQEAMYKYLQNYGTFRERQKAITEEYSKKIADAGGADTWQGKLLQKEMEKALSDLDLEKLKQGINWELVFGDLDKVSKESLNKVKQQLKDFKNSEEYKNMAVDQKKVIDEALDNIQTTLIDKGGLLADLPEQLNELAKAQEELTQAQEEYNEAMKSGTDEQKESAAKKLNDAQKKQQNAQNNVQKSADKARSNLMYLSGAINELGNSSEVSLTSVGNLMSGIIDIVGKGGDKISGIIGSIFSLLDNIGSQGLDGFIGNVVKSMANAAYGAWDTIFGWTGIDFGGESDPHLQEDLERLTLSNQDLIKSLDNLAEKMDESAVADATDIYEQQKKNIEDQIANTQEMMRRSAAAYSNGFLGIGGTHSSNKKINEAMSAEDWKRVSEAAGVSVKSASDFWNLTSEQMYNVANDATDLYSKIKQYADDGYQNASQYMDDYIEYWKQLEELENAYREKLTDTSFDTVRDEFKNSLLDMESDAEDFAENFEKMMQQAVVESMMSDTYAKRLKDWYKSFADSMTDGTLTGTEQSDLKSQWDQIVSDALAERDAIMQAMGWDSSSSEQQSASSRGFGTEMTHEDAGELSGRFTAVYESNLRIESAEQQQTVAITELRGSISALTSQASSMYNIADETRTILANSYLELQQIRENTGEIVKPIKQMQADIAEVKRNTSRL